MQKIIFSSLLYIFTLNLYAEVSFAYLETKAAIFFHPKMQDFSFFLNRFKRQKSDFSQISPAEWEASLEAKLTQLNRVLDSLYFEEKDNQLSLDQELQAIAANNPSELVLGLQTKVLSDYENHYKEQRQAALETVREWFLSEKETILTFKQIHKEILVIAKQIKAEYKFSSLIETNILAQKPLIEPEVYLLDNQSLAAFDIADFILDRQPKNGAYFLKEYAIQNKDSLIELDNYLFSEPFIYGALDITPLVIQKLWQPIKSQLDLVTTMKYLYESLVKFKLNKREYLLKEATL